MWARTLGAAEWPGLRQTVEVPSLRALTTDDWPLWRDVRLAALTEAPHVFKSGLAGWYRGGEERWRWRLDLPGSYNLVAMLDGRPAGMASGVPRDDNVSELRSVWVSPDARGRGVGDLLIGAVETWALKAGVATLELAVLPGNDPAIALYRRHGFVVTGELSELLPDGVTREQMMAKPLR